MFECAQIISVRLVFCLAFITCTALNVRFKLLAVLLRIPGDLGFESQREVTLS
jgi:hypothetical protein